jgi:hypothetical protein
VSLVLSLRVHPRQQQLSSDNSQGSNSCGVISREKVCQIRIYADLFKKISDYPPK